jgi:hypothetical protein
MARHSRRQRTRTRKMRGGGYGSAASYGEYVNGTTDAQFNRVFGPEYANVPGNIIIGAQGQNITPPTRMPTPAQLAAAQSAQLSAAQSGGKRKKTVGGIPMSDGPGVNPYAPIRPRPMQPNVWDVLSQSSDPRMTYATGMGGRRRKRGGFFGEAAVNQAVVPFALLGMQQTYRRKRGGRRTRKH